MLAIEPLASHLRGLFRYRRTLMRTLKLDVESSSLGVPAGAGDFGLDEPLPFRFALRVSADELAETLLTLRTLRALDVGAARYPIHRVERCAVRKPGAELLDDMAVQSGLAAHRLSESSLLLDGAGSLVSVRAMRKADYTSCTLAIWASDRERLAAVRDCLLGILGDQRIRDETFTIDWCFMGGVAGLTSASFQETVDPPPFDEAYPGLGESVTGFIERFLASPETVLILQGPPGTGKTRLVRAILAAISRGKEAGARVLYTADKRALENDEIFVDFITGMHDAFVIEDADHILASRSKGNLDLHRFLAVADGVVRAQGRKIIFTTNLPNVGDIDDALLRPGRCFAVVRTRALARDETARLIERLHPESTDLRDRSLGVLFDSGDRGATLAAIYRAAQP